MKVYDLGTTTWLRTTPTSSDQTAINAVNANATNINTVAGISSNVTTVAGISGNVTTVAGISANVTSVAGNASNINQVASDTVAINAASANAASAASSATAAAGSATSASASAAAASAVALGNEPVRHSVRPSLLLDFANTKTLDPRITFTRASTGTFYDGKTVAKAEENLLLNSQALESTGWSAAAVTRTANTDTAPDGTSTADKITNTATTAIHGISTTGISSIASASYALSVFVKKGTVRFVALGFWNSSGAAECGAGFDLDTGTVTGTGAVGSGYSASGATITVVGNNWYRITVICVSPATSNFFAVLNRSTSYSSGRITESYAGTTSEETLLWGAQLEQRSSVTAYTATTTAPITNYIPALQTATSGTARFEHNPVTGESLGLEIEEQRTNLAVRSEDLSTTWVNQNTTEEVNVAIAPDGTLTADKLVETADSNPHAIYQDITTTAAAHTFTIFAKAAGRNFLAIYNTTVLIGKTFNISTGAVVGNIGTAPTSASITDVGNGWYRCSVTMTTTAASNRFRVYLSTDGTDNTTYIGNGFSGAFLWGAQLEAGAFATSYIPTVASQVTRSADAASMTGTNFSSWYRADKWTMYAEAENRNGLASSLNYSIASLSDGTGANSQIIRIEGSDNRTATFGSNNGAANQWLLYGTAITRGSFGKTALAYELNSVGFSHNGATPSSDTSAQIPAANTLYIGASGSNAQLLNGCIRKFAFYPARNTNAELQGLTTV